jgi:hypothetical protein
MTRRSALCVRTPPKLWSCGLQAMNSGVPEWSPRLLIRPPGVYCLSHRLASRCKIVKSGAGRVFGPLDFTSCSARRTITLGFGVGAGLSSNERTALAA